MICLNLTQDKLFWFDAFQPLFYIHFNVYTCHSWLEIYLKKKLTRITILISKDHDLDIYLISRYIAKTVVLLSLT